MKEYLVVGAEYFSDGMWGPVEIFKGSLKDCRDFCEQEYFHGTMQYKDMRIIKPEKYKDYLMEFDSDDYE